MTDTNLAVKNAAGSTVYLKETGAGSDVDPNVPVVTANLSATDNAVLDTIDAVLDTINAKLVTGTVIGDVNLGATDNAVLDAAVATLGATSGAAVITDANGTIQQYLRGLVTLDLIDNTVLDAINAKLVTGTVIGDVNLGATDNAVLDVVAAQTSAINTKLATGTVIGDVNLGATDNAVLDVIAAQTSAINTKLATGTVIGDVNLGATDNAVLDAAVATLGATSGAAVITDANGTIQQYLRGLVTLDLIDNTVLDAINAKLVTGTVIGDVNLGATDNAVLDAIAASVAGATPAGTNAIGKLAANSGIDIGDVDITSIVPGAAATNLGKAEDAAHSSGDVGVMGLGVRADSLAPTGANGDYVPHLMDANGAQYVTLGTKIDPVNDSIMPYTLTANFISGCTAAVITDTSASQLIAAQAAGVRIYVTSLLVTNSDATVGTQVEIRDGTTTVLWAGYAAPLGGGFSCTFPVPLKGTAATALNAYCITTSSETRVSVAGYIGA